MTWKTARDKMACMKDSDELLAVHYLPCVHHRIQEFYNDCILLSESNKVWGKHKWKESKHRAAHIYTIEVTSVQGQSFEGPGPRKMKMKFASSFHGIILNDDAVHKFVARLFVVRRYLSQDFLLSCTGVPLFGNGMTEQDFMSRSFRSFLYQVP